MTTIMGSLLVAMSLTMIGFSFHAGYVPVSFPTYRVYRHRRVYFWTLIACYTLVCAMGCFILAN